MSEKEVNIIEDNRNAEDIFCISKNAKLNMPSFNHNKLDQYSNLPLLAYDIVFDKEGTFFKILLNHLLDKSAHKAKHGYGTLNFSVISFNHCIIPKQILISREFNNEVKKYIIKKLKQKGFKDIKYGYDIFSDGFYAIEFSWSK